MPPPQTVAEVLGPHRYLTVLPGPAREVHSVSIELAELLKNARESYVWPGGVDRIAALEQHAQEQLAIGTAEALHSILYPVADWGGARQPALDSIAEYDEERKLHAALRIRAMHQGGNLQQALLGLCSLPGIGFVIASKIYRFVRPDVGAAVDRHASYFFNSLQLRRLDNRPAGLATEFRREWATGAHTTSRMAVYQPDTLQHTAQHYCARYLPILASTAAALNRQGIRYHCVQTGQRLEWRPADVDMAAFSWWKDNGPS